MSHVHVTTEGGIATITIDHPPINLITIEVFLELAGAVQRVAADDSVRVVVLRSAVAGWFAAHFDVAAILQFPTDQPEATELNAYHQMCETLRTMPAATIAVVDGRVGGGGSELTLGCDMRFASTESIFSQPEVALGIIPGGGGTTYLPRLVGRSRALEAVLGCDHVDALTAERWGWINRAMPSAELDGFVDRLARRIAGFPIGAIAAAKASVLRSELPVPEQLLAEGNAFNRTLGDPAAREAMQRFLDLGGQTPEGERRLGELVGELSAG